MGALATAVEAIPGSDKVKITPYRREKRSPVVQVAIAIGAIAAMIVVFVVKPASTRPDLSGVAAAMATAEGVAAVDMPQIPAASEWRAAQAADFVPDVAAWIKSTGAAPSGRVPLQIEPGNKPIDVAYWLVKNQGTESRLVVLQNGTNIYDAQYPDLVGIARVPSVDLAGIEWLSKPNAEPNGDAVILLRRSEEGIIGRILFFNAQRLHSAVPARYDQVNLQ